MIKIEVLGYIVENAVKKSTPDTKKEYAFFTVKSTDEKKITTLVKCYYYGCSEKKLKSLKAGCKVLLWGRQKLNLFLKDNGEVEININVNISDLQLI